MAVKNHLIVDEKTSLIVRCRLLGVCLKKNEKIIDQHKDDALHTLEGHGWYEGESASIGAPGYLRIDLERSPKPRATMPQQRLAVR